MQIAAVPLQLLNDACMLLAAGGELRCAEQQQAEPSPSSSDKKSSASASSSEEGSLSSQAGTSDSDSEDAGGISRGLSSAEVQQALDPAAQAAAAAGVQPMRQLACSSVELAAAYMQCVQCGTWHSAKC
jgi:hypothetical protein